MRPVVTSLSPFEQTPGRKIYQHFFIPPAAAARMRAQEIELTAI
jgi:hypothetical protein